MLPSAAPTGKHRQRNTSTLGIVLRANAKELRHVGGIQQGDRNNYTALEAAKKTEISARGRRDF